MTTEENYSLFVDGVAWVPAATDGDTDVFIVASGGRFVFYDERGNVMFAFYNHYASDFSISGQVYLYQLDSGGRDIGVTTANRTYAQLQSVESITTGFRVRLLGNYTGTPAESLTPSTNNGSVTSFTTTTDNLVIVVEGGNLSDYTQIMLGNVLLAFISGRG